MSGSPAANQFWTSIFRIPLRIFFVGLSIIALMGIWRLLGLPDLSGLGSWLFTPRSDATHPGLDPSAALAALLVFGIGLVVVGMLWWLIDRFFEMIEKGEVKPDLTAIRDLPLGLPEGTIRSILALFVGVVGLPILIFSNALHLADSIAGYVNGIIAGVFGFYFGSRTASTQQTAGQAAAMGRALDANSAAAAATIKALESERDAAVHEGQSRELTDPLTRHVELASVLLDQIGPLLPPTLLPDGLAAARDAGRSALAALAGSPPSAALTQQAEAAIAGLVSGSAIDKLVKTAAPVCGATPAHLSALLALGWNLGSAPYQRWYALLLAAPVTGALLDGGALSETAVTNAIDAAGTLPSAWKTAASQPGFVQRLCAVALADDAVETLWSEFSAPGTTGGIFADRAEIVAGLGPLRREILAARFRADITDAALKPARDALGSPADPDLQLTSAINADALLSAARTASIASAAAAPTDPAQASFDALVMLTGLARQNNVDLPKALGEVKP